MQTLIQKLSFSAIMKVLGALSAVLAAIQALHEPSVSVALQDPTLYRDVLLALLGFFGKSNNAHGTPAAPIPPPVAAAMIASALPAVPLISFVGEPVGGSATLYSVKAGDPTAVGQSVTEHRGTFAKRSSEVYEKLAV